jgi:tetratricopeptide (TPR) repeat protein
MENTGYIESYFTNELAPEQAREFEKRIEMDPGFAEEVAFYLSTLNIARDVSQTEKKERFKKLYWQNEIENEGQPKAVPFIPTLGHVSGKTPVRKLIYYFVAAAAVAGIFFGIYYYTNNVSPQQLAIQYEKEKLQTLEVTMSSKRDSMQSALSSYNNGNTAEALAQFEQIIRSDTSNFTAKENAGLAALRLNEYDKALMWFKELETYSGNYSNPALFYQALTLMTRNQSGDVAKAKQLLEQVVTRNLERKETAEDWLKKW